MTTGTTQPAASTAGTRNVTLADLAGLLRDQQARAVDIVAPTAAVRARSGQLVMGTDRCWGRRG